MSFLQQKENLEVSGTNLDFDSAYTAKNLRTLIMENDNDIPMRREYKMYDRLSPFHDAKDDSVHPSYTHFQTPYCTHSTDKYIKSHKKYRRQFRKEINKLIAWQCSATEAARLNRNLSYTTLWPPLHNRKEIIWSQKNCFTLSTEGQRKRLERIMSNDIT